MRDAADNLNLAARDMSQDIDTVAPSVPWLVTGSAFKPVLDPQVLLHTSLGDVLLELNSAKAPNTTTAQFFVNLVDNAFLNYASAGSPGFAVFGQVILGMSVIDAMATVATSTRGFQQDVPVNDIFITSASQTVVGSTISNTGSFTASGLESGGHFEYSMSTA